MLRLINGFLSYFCMARLRERDARACLQALLEIYEEKGQGAVREHLRGFIPAAELDSLVGGIVGLKDFELEERYWKEKSIKSEFVRNPEAMLACLKDLKKLGAIESIGRTQKEIARRRRGPKRR